jgi:hypothetical protein
MSGAWLGVLNKSRTGETCKLRGSSQCETCRLWVVELAAFGASAKAISLEGGPAGYTLMNILGPTGLLRQIFFSPTSKNT